MKILITGGRGMLGRTLVRRLQVLPGTSVIALSSRELDVGNAAACTLALAKHQPQVVLHCGAMTRVDACETQQDLAWRVNAIGCANIASACELIKARLIAISTDYVFSGDLSRPYHEWDDKDARTVYGQSKCAGEEMIRHHCPNHIIARVAWLYGPGGPSFVHTMLKMGGQEGPALKVVDDQIGNPTSTDAVADALLPLVDSSLVGTMHLTCEGEASWYQLARTIFTINNFQRELTPCASKEYPRPAARPANSCLEKRALRLHQRPPMQDWRYALQRFFTEFPNG
jgi:dTDP-4-dehydrorhamnose reductase